MSKETVVLEQAWGWDCPGCNARQFSESSELILSSEEVAEMGMDPSMEGASCLLAPEEVTCENCGQKWPAKSFLESVLDGD